MATRSIVGRFLILAVLIVSLGVVAQAALIITQGGGKKAVKTAAVPAPTPAPAPAAPDMDPVRVVYPGPLGDAPTLAHKIADSAPASPLPASPEPAASTDPAAPPQPTAKLAQAMAATAAASPSAAPAPQPAQPAPLAQPAPTVAASPSAAPAPQPTQPAPTAPPAEGIEVASLGGDAPAADAAPSGSININKASVEALNRLGGGHIGEAIAKHRPYRSVEELVSKRILRRSVYEQIKNQIAAQ